MAAEKAAAALAMSVGSQEPCADGVLPFELGFGLGLLLSPGRSCPLRTAPVGTTFVGELIMRARFWSDEKEKLGGQTRHVEVREHTNTRIRINRLFQVGGDMEILLATMF